MKSNEEKLKGLQKRFYKFSKYCEFIPLLLCLAGAFMFYGVIVLLCS